MSPIEWLDRWDIQSEADHATYFIGIKLISDIEIQLTWVEIEINTNNGIARVVDKGVL